jgi:hypothetical protein
LLLKVTKLFNCEKNNEKIKISHYDSKFTNKPKKTIVLPLKKQFIERFFQNQNCQILTNIIYNKQKHIYWGFSTCFSILFNLFSNALGEKKKKKKEVLKSNQVA